MEGWQIALVVLVAVLVGSLIPLVVQLYATIQTLRKVAEKSAKDVEAALVGIHRTADRLDRLGAALEKDGKMEAIIEGATSAAQMVNQLRSTMQIAGPVAAAIVPAAMAAVRAWKGSMESDASPATPEEPPAHEHHPHKRKEAEG
jgi:phosphoribosylcarboxyaminoimidazole (NCAIR) mutase